MWYLFFLSQRPPPRSTRTDTLVPYTTLFRSTTGVPKGAMLSHGNLVANVLQLQAVARPALRDLEHTQLTIISALPLYHVFAMTVCGLFGIYAGMRNLLIINPRDQPALIDAWRKAGMNIFPGVNTLFNALAHNAEFATLDFSGLRLTMEIGRASCRERGCRYGE